MGGHKGVYSYSLSLSLDLEYMELRPAILLLGRDIDNGKNQHYLYNLSDGWLLEMRFHTLWSLLVFQFKHILCWYVLVVTRPKGFIFACKDRRMF